LETIKNQQMTFTDYARTIEKQLAQGNTEYACEALSALIQDKNEAFYQQTILLSGQYQEINRNELLGLEDDQFGVNRINNSLIQLCGDIKKEFGTEKIDAETQKRLNNLPEVAESVVVFQPKTPSVKSVPAAQKSLIQRWFPSIIAVALLVLGWQAYRWFTKPKVSGETEMGANIADSQNQNASQRGMPNNAPNTEGGSGVAQNAPEIPPVFLDFKAKSQNVTISESRLYSFGSFNRLVLIGNYLCEFDNRGGCNFGASELRLVIDGTSMDTKSENFVDDLQEGYGNFLISGNSQLYFKVTYDIPATAKVVNLQIKVDGTSTFPIDFKKAIASIPEKPNIVNLTQEVDLKIAKNFGNNFQILFVKVAPYDDNNFQLITRVSRPQDIMDLERCVRVLTDNGEGIRQFDGQKRKEVYTSKERTDTDFYFKLPRTVHLSELMVGNCRVGELPYKVPLKL
jgi:hypothetical protein